jgi:hypothetical protein
MQKTWVVKYQLPPDNRYRERHVQAYSQSDAIRVAKAEMPSARIVGGPQELRPGR